MVVAHLQKYVITQEEVHSLMEVVREVVHSLRWVEEFQGEGYLCNVNGVLLLNIRKKLKFARLRRNYS